MRTTAPEHLDVVIVGAGLSGIGAACHLQRRCPELSWTILEARDRIGGTWDRFRYPGVRADSDMHTLGYSFAPWDQPTAIADGASILRYLIDTARAHGVLESVRTRHRALRAQWSSATARWTLEVGGPGGEPATLSCAFLMVCTGYFRYEGGHSPRLPGAERFPGPIVHPQRWPEQLDWTGRRVVVIGSGATAVTLVPAMAPSAAHVTMLQRSPSYIVSLPSVDVLAQRLDGRLPARLAHLAARAKNVALMTGSYQLSRRRPRLMRALIRRGVQRRLPPGYDVDTHFAPEYDPWDQRLCVVPDGDLFKAISAGTASIVTDRIETLTERGLMLRSGRELEADVIVTATGLELLALGGIELVVDDEPIDLPSRLVYRGMMLDGVPNLTFAVGYTNASWTLKSDLVAQYGCRLLRHLRRHGLTHCVAIAPEGEQARRPLIDLASGYVRRSMHEFPAQGSRRPWRLHQNYLLDVLELRLGRLQDGVLRCSGGREAPAAGASAAVAASDTRQPALSGWPVDCEPSPASPLDPP